MARKMEEVIPSPRRMIEWIRRNNFTPMQVIGEYVDNAIENGASNVHVRIVHGQKEKYIEIMDDGSGMTPVILDKQYLRLGSETDDLYHRHSWSMLGIGSKTGFTIADHIEATTKVYGGIEPIGIAMDADVIAEDGRWLPRPLKITEEMMGYFRDHVGEHGTIVRLKRLMSHMDDASLKDLADKLPVDMGLSYGLKHHHPLHRRKVNIDVNGRPVVFSDPTHYEEALRGDGLVELLMKKKILEFRVGGKLIQIQLWATHMPHASEVEGGKKNKLGYDLKPQSAGIYAYREWRLAARAEWLGLFFGETHVSSFRAGIAFDRDADSIIRVDATKQKPQFIPAVQKRIEEELGHHLRDSNKKRRSYTLAHRDPEKLTVLEQLKNARTKIKVLEAQIAKKDAEIESLTEQIGTLKERIKKIA